MAIFALQDVIKDPPFTKLDLVCCRNLLIYLEPPLQKKLLPLFHYALKPDGILLLGSSESIGGSTDLFVTINHKYKIFARREVPSFKQRMRMPAFPITSSGFTRQFQHLPVKTEKTSISQIVDKMLLESYAPPCAIINQNNEIIYIHGRTGKYLEPSGTGQHEYREHGPRGSPVRVAVSHSPGSGPAKQCHPRGIAGQG